MNGGLTSRTIGGEMAPRNSPTGVASYDSFDTGEDHAQVPPSTESTQDFVDKIIEDLFADHQEEVKTISKKFYRLIGGLCGGFIIALCGALFAAVKK